MDVLEIRSLGCGYRFPLLEISYRLETGEYLFLKGANGMGKTTLVKTLVGGLAPLHGEVLFNGQNLHKRSALFQDLFYLAEKIEVPDFLTPVQYIHLIAEYYHVKVDQNRLSDGIDLLKMKTLVQLTMRNLSMGQKRRAQLLAAFVLKRKLIVLDDPLIAIDNEGYSFFPDFVHQINSGGLLIFTGREEIPSLHSVDMALFRREK